MEKLYRRTLSLSPCPAAVDEEEVPKNAGISHNTATKMRPTPLTAVVEEEVHKQAVHPAIAGFSLNMAMKMKAVGPRQRCRQTSDMSWVGTTCRP